MKTECTKTRERGENETAWQAICVKDLWEELRTRLDRRRCAHVQGVAETVKKLTLLHGGGGANAKKAEIAALFHDWFRAAPDEELNRLIALYELDPVLLNRPNLSHAKLAAAYMEKERGITDADLLNAVRYHTTGRAGMSKLEKLLYLADAIEPAREYPGLGALRALAKTDLDAACMSALEHSIRHVQMKKLPLDEDSRKAWQWLHDNGPKKEKE
ncbi:MAG: bis(5'-nucleosyl)-tetraphosphatase (symmetrical) YqeK [Clostridiales Family XIII bacterium]|jgi:predicted HD superfamily hydrolase involved in NAD metabolism|nr:bis(5'-nucleosyl)-tetraphosphatase (symmetrical) YqeK [Clostridiales Family XIII bacterium]